MRIQVPKPTENLLIAYRRLSKRQRSIFWAAATIVALLVFPTVVNLPGHRALQKAHMYFLNPPATGTIGQSFPLELRVKTNGTPINAVGAVVTYNPLYLEIVNMTTDTSFCSFYLEHTFDNIKGEAHISCGLPNPGFLGDSVVVHLNMRPKIAGTTEIKVVPSEAKVLANTGKGENIIDQAPKFSLNITQLF